MTNLERPVLQVDLSDGTSHTVTILNASLVAWDRTRATQKWPTLEHAPTLWMTFITWHHLKAAGVVSCTYEEYERDVCLAVGDPAPEKPDEDADDQADGLERVAVGEESVAVETVDPTRPALELASRSS